MQSISYYLKHRNVLFNVILAKVMLLLPDKAFIKLKFRKSIGYRLNLGNPRTYNEKLQWLKLYDRRPEYTMMVDKVKVKDYVTSLIGEQYIIPTLGIWDDPDKIDFDLLPDRFVLKCNHNSGLGMYICKDKTRMDVNKVRKDLRKGLDQNYFLKGREWPYKNVPRRILAEAYIDPAPDVKDLLEYRWFCFDGEPKYCQVIKTDYEYSSFFDVNWNHLLDINSYSEEIRAANIFLCPAHLDTQLRIARELSKGLSLSGINLYETGKQSFFGEVLSYHSSGFNTFCLGKYDVFLKQICNLPGEIMNRVVINEFECGKLDVTPPDLQDYKIYCFNGVPRMVMVAHGRFTDHKTFDYYTLDWQKIPMTWGANNSDKIVSCPINFDLMIELSKKLSAGLPHVRVDMYNVHGKLYFGELTFFDSSGFELIEPSEYDLEMGKWLELPIIK